jgi:translation elongation factor P/translation initiation factor 5A
MQTILPSEFKRQMVLMLDSGPHVIEDLHTSGTAQTKHKLHTRLRHLTTGRLIDRVFAESERVPVAPLETGLQVMVPLFIANGDSIRVDTAGKKYLGKEPPGG